MVIPMSESTHSPLARLVLFMICLSVAGTFVAGAHYDAVDLPQQELQPPQNMDDQTRCIVDNCELVCEYWYTTAKFVCERRYDSCVKDCERQYPRYRPR